MHCMLHHALLRCLVSCICLAGCCVQCPAWTQLAAKHISDCVCAGIDIETGRLSNSQREDGSLHCQAEVISRSSFRQRSCAQMSPNIESSSGGQGRSSPNRASQEQTSSSLPRTADVDTKGHTHRFSGWEASAGLVWTAPAQRLPILQQPPEPQRAASMQTPSDHHNTLDEQHSSDLQRVSVQSSPSSMEGSPQSLWSYLDLMKRRGRLGSLNLNDIELAQTHGS